ncbi:MAG: TlpA family protein disulfide reductase [Phenylobacterium sp.]
MNEQSAAKPRGGVLTWALWGAAAMGVAGVVYIIAQASTNTPASKPAVTPGAAVGAKSSFASKVSRPSKPTPPPDLAFLDKDGKPVKIADLKGKVVVMNIWATWCGPCKVEMPTLARLQADYAAKGVVVMPVSIDSDDKAGEATAFIGAQAPLGFYRDKAMKLPFQLSPPAEGTPTTVIYGRHGLEFARVTGEADWTSAQARALVDQALAAS